MVLPKKEKGSMTQAEGHPEPPHPLQKRKKQLQSKPNYHHLHLLFPITFLPLPLLLLHLLYKITIQTLYRLLLLIPTLLYCSLFLSSPSFSSSFFFQFCLNQFLGGTTRTLVEFYAENLNKTQLSILLNHIFSQ